MKKKLLILLLTILTACCLCLIAGCSLFVGGFDDGNGSYGDNTPPSSTGGSALKTPESVKLNMPLKTLYIADCSESGVTFYSVTQEYGKTKNSLGNFSAKDKEVKDGFFEMSVAKLTETDEFDIVVYCNSTASLSGGVSKTYTFKNAGGITYDEEHCTFDSETGLFTWTDMEDATGYRLELGYNNYTVVDKPQVVVDESITQFTVTPLFDVYKFGSSVTIYLGSAKPSISYNAYSGAFVWSQSADKYKVEITENGETTTWEVEEEILPFIPSSNSVTIKISSDIPLHWPVFAEVTYDVITPITGISVGTYSCELNWNAVNAQGYNLILKYEDGRTEFKETTEPKFALNKNNTGKITAKIIPVQYYTQNPSIILYADFDFTVLTGLNALTPTLSVDEDTDKLTVEIPKEEEFVTGYTVTLKFSALNSQSVEVDATSPSLSAKLDLTKNKPATLTILRNIGEGDGHYCFTSTASLLTESYYRQIMYADAPEVTVIDKNATYLSGPAMVVQVDIPQELEGISGWNLRCNYDYTFTRTANMQSGTQFTIPITQSSATLQINYSPTNSSTTLFKGSFEKTVVRLNSVDISADGQKLSWQSVDGAVEYRVEEADGGDYNEVYSGALTQYIHGVNSVGEWSYRVIAKSDDPFVLDSEADECTVTKLEKPTVSMDIFGELEITPPDTAASVLTLLNGVAKELSKDNLRAALTNGDSATLTARSVKEGTKKEVFIDSDDTDTYTLHRIGDLLESALDIEVDPTANTVSFAALQGADEYVTRLLQKLPKEGDFNLVRTVTGPQTQISGTELGYGQFKLEVKPANRGQGQNFYLYLGDYIAGYFRKDGIVDITPLEDGSGFALDSYIFSTETVAGWKVSTPGLIVDNTYLFDFGDDIIFTQNLMNDILGRYTGDNNLTFSVNYSAAAEAALSQSKTLKADEFKITYNLIQSTASSNFKGSYSYVDRQDDPTAPAQARIALTPAQNEVLSAAERYTVVYKSKAVGANNSTATLVSETLGTELLVQVGNERVTRMFRLGIESNRFIKEGGKINFYRSSKEPTDDTWYEFSAQATYEATLTVLGSTTSNGKMTISFNLSFANHTPINYESFYLEYRADDGTWQPVLIDGKINALVSGKSSFDLQFDQPDDIAYFPGKIIQIRVKSGSCSYSLTNLKESDWTYLTLTVPRY